MAYYKTRYTALDQTARQPYQLQLSSILGHTPDSSSSYSARLNAFRTQKQTPVTSPDPSSYNFSRTKSFESFKPGMGFRMDSRPTMDKLGAQRSLDKQSRQEDLGGYASRQYNHSTLNNFHTRDLHQDVMSGKFSFETKGYTPSAGTSGAGQANRLQSLLQRKAEIDKRALELINRGSKAHTSESTLFGEDRPDKDDGKGLK